MSYLFFVSFRYIIRKLKVKPGAHVFVLSDFVVQKVLGKKQPISETYASGVEDSETEFLDKKKQDEKKQETHDKSQKCKSKFSSKKTS